MTLPVGTQLGSLHVERQIGAGGMGEVYLARDGDLNRTVAVKVLPADVTADAPRVARFEQEARAASALNHPNVCVIHALGRTADGRRFIAMEHVEGETLRERVLRGRLPLREALDVAIQIASALTAAHAAGIVHRDLKPENVMVRRDRLVKVLDFGLAKLLPAEAAAAAHEPTRTMFATEPGALVGTTTYMSPEQARGAEVDARTDIWALGVVLYEMVTGRPPFTGSTRSDVLAAILEREPKALAEVEASLPRELQRIAGKALRKDPDQRYQVMKDLLLDLEALRDELAVAVGSAASVTSRAGRWRQTRFNRVAPAAALLAAAAVGGAWWWTSRAADPPAAASAVPSSVTRPLSRLTFEGGLQTHVSFAPDGRSIAYASDQTGNFDIWVQPITGGGARQLTKSPAQETQPSWSPDGRRIVFRSERDGGGLFVVSVDGGPERHVSSFGEHPEWMPDGSEILFRSGAPPHMTAHVVSPDGGDSPRGLLGDFLADGARGWIAPHPDGRFSVIGVHPERRFGFFTVSRDGRSVTTSRLLPDLPLSSSELTLIRFRWNHTGTALYVETPQQGVRNIWRVSVDPKTLAWVSAERLTTGAGPDVAFAVSRDDTRLAYTALRESTRLWALPFDATRGEVTGEGRPVSPEDGRVGPSALSPDGTRVAYTLWRAGRTDSELWVVNIDTGERESFGANGDPGAWSRDGRLLAYLLSRPSGDEDEPLEWAVAVRELGGAERIVRRWTTTSQFFPMDWTPDNQSIVGPYLAPVFARSRLAVRRYADASAAPSERIFMDDPANWLWQPVLSPNGRWLAFVAQPVQPPFVTRIAVASAGGQPAAEWAYLGAESDWNDKPRWAPDGRMLYFLSRRNSPFFNLWRQKFDPERGRLLGEPVRITVFDSPAFAVDSNMARSEAGVAQHVVVLTMVRAAGNLWMLENVHR